MVKGKSEYPIEFVNDVFGESPVLADTLRKVTGAEKPRIALVADMNVVQRRPELGSKIGHYVTDHQIDLVAPPAVIACGEKIKSDRFDHMANMNVIARSLLDAKVGKNDCVVILGGGCLLDLAGYVAAQIRGGLKVVRIPTTPAAMMDAAYATYAAINSENVKDALRVSCVPAAVLVDFSLATTVLEGVWRSGLAFAARQAAVSDAAFLKRIATLSPAYFGKTDKMAFEMIVRDTVGLRQKKGAPEIGEWAAMRLESMSFYRLPHGYAVAIGVCIDAYYACVRGLIPEKTRDVIVNLMLECGGRDALRHSRHLVTDINNLICGIDAWMLQAGAEGLQAISSLGRKIMETDVDRELYRKAISDFVMNHPAEPAKI